MREREIAYTDFSERKKYSGYNTGTAAYDINFEKRIQEENKRILMEERRKKRIKMERAEARLNAKQLVMLAASAVIFCAGCIVSIIGVSSVAEMRYSIQQLRNDLSTIQNENIVLSSEISDTINLEYIEDRAINELGMTEPQSYQIRTITVPEQSYTVQYDDDSQDNVKVDEELVKEFFSNVRKD